VKRGGNDGMKASAKASVSENGEKWPNHEEN
jgi:hypothetical protein